MKMCAALVALLVTLGAELTACAQPWSTELPTPQGGDYGNGAAVSDVIGGVFTGGDRAASIPAIAFGIPTGFGADWRDVFAAAGLQRGLRYDRDFTDGAVFGGVGLGDAQRNVGIELTLAVVDLVGETFKDHTIGVKMHRRLGAMWSVAAGIENLIVTGTTDGGTSAYGVVSGALPLDPSRQWLQRMTLTAGVGDGRFNTEDRVRREENGAGVFGGVAVQVRAMLSMLATWTGQDLNIGLSIAPFDELPVVVTPVLLDVTGKAGDGVRFALSAGVGITL
jgi:hypothetical protein